MDEKVRRNPELIGHNPEATWRVGYLVKPTMEIRYWEGQAPNYFAAQLFATKAIRDEGFWLVQHIVTERVK